MALNLRKPPKAKFDSTNNLQTYFCIPAHSAPDREAMALNTPSPTTYAMIENALSGETIVSFRSRRSRGKWKLPSEYRLGHTFRSPASANLGITDFALEAKALPRLFGACLYRSPLERVRATHRGLRDAKLGESSQLICELAPPGILGETSDHGSSGPTCCHQSSPCSFLEC
jgi:hypothetical protein